jgi:hypothetical protein
MTIEELKNQIKIVRRELKERDEVITLKGDSNTKLSLHHALLTLFLQFLSDFLVLLLSYYQYIQFHPLLFCPQIIHQIDYFHNFNHTQHFYHLSMCIYDLHLYIAFVLVH